MNIRTKMGLRELLRRYLEAGVTDETPDRDGLKAGYITEIKQCIEEDLAMDETDYQYTPAELRRLWRGLK